MADWPSSPAPDFQSQVEYLDRYITVEFDDGYQHVRPAWPRPRRRWRLHYSVLTEAEKDTLVNAYQSYRGQRFTFGDPLNGEGTFTVVITKPFGLRRSSPNTWEFEIELEEVW